MQRLSIIIPGYNTPQFMWRRCLVSLLKACNPTDEIICVNDGSATDLTVQFLGVDNEPRIKIINLEKNVGQAAARNYGLEIAQGEYVTFVDSDDEIIPGCYDKCIDAAEKYKSDIVVYGLRTVWVNDGLYKENFMEERNCGVPSAQDICDLRKFLLFDYPVNKIYRRFFIEQNKIRFKAGICPGEDMAFNLECLLAMARISIVPTIGYIYYRMDGTTLSRAYANLRETLIYRTHLWDLYQKQLPGLEETGVCENYSEKDILRAEWRNLWRRGSKTTFLTRYKFAKEHEGIFNSPVLLEVLCLLLFRFARRFCYVRVIRRWHIKRLYPYAKEYTLTEA
ncbi:MAG: glycosyltransferase family 2 protein [Kiritimatiellae bacterium]|nr:glycosyltransferase family 2 protein [Kiritimatiellia bacterium]